MDKFKIELIENEMYVQCPHCLFNFFNPFFNGHISGELQTIK